MGDLLLQLKGICKSFGANKALDHVDLEIKSGEVHALVGENGAGKSTLMKILSGVIPPDEGTMFFHGNPYLPKSTHDARMKGISMIYQELNIAPHLTVEENMTLGLETNMFGLVVKQSEIVSEVLSQLGHAEIDPSVKTGALKLAKQQIVEIARSLMIETEVVIMDEPTSSISLEDKRALFGIVKQLTEKGIAVIYISHFLEEIQEIADRYTVLRDGRTVDTGEIENTTLKNIIQKMVGREVTELYPTKKYNLGEVVLDVNDVSSSIQPTGKASFMVRRGEILGVAGLIGAGRTEAIKAIFGIDKAISGEVTINSKPSIKAYLMHPALALTSGVDYLSEDRKEEGLALNLSVGDNITLSTLAKYARWGFIQQSIENQSIWKWIHKLNIKSGTPENKVNNLSGGNQQKLCIARLLNHDSDILFLDEPTKGVDVGSKSEIYRIISQLADQGKAIVLISSYLPELFGICNSLAVMYKGTLSMKKKINQWTEEEVMLFATSGKMNIFDEDRK